MMAYLLVGLIGLLALGFCFLVVRAFQRWTGGWRWALAVPVASVVILVLEISIGISRDPTAHNLWPFELLARLCLAYMIVGFLALARWLGAIHARPGSASGG